MARLPARMRPLFWELDIARLDTQKDVDSILARVLEVGTLEDVRWAVRTYGLPRIHRFFREVGHPEIGPWTVAAWRAILGAEKERWASPPAWRRNSNVPWVD